MGPQIYTHQIDDVKCLLVKPGFVDPGYTSNDSLTKKYPDEIGNQMDPDSDRFTAIRKYMFDNRRQLALDTLHTKSAEHQLLSYILANGGLDIGAIELREFLQACTSLKQLFM